jgi:DNA-binding transcriptional MerR regulator
MAVSYWTTRDVAEHLQITEATVRAYLARGQMPRPDQRYGRTNLWRPATIERWRKTIDQKGDQK